MLSWSCSSLGQHTGAMTRLERKPNTRQSPSALGLAHNAEWGTSLLSWSCSSLGQKQHTGAMTRLERHNTPSFGRGRGGPSGARVVLVVVVLKKPRQPGALRHVVLPDPVFPRLICTAREPGKFLFFLHPTVHLRPKPSGRAGTGVKRSQHLLLFVVAGLLPLPDSLHVALGGLVPALLCLRKRVRPGTLGQRLELRYDQACARLPMHPCR